MIVCGTPAQAQAQISTAARRAASICCET